MAQDPNYVKCENYIKTKLPTGKKNSIKAVKILQDMGIITEAAAMLYTMVDSRIRVWREAVKNNQTKERPILSTERGFCWAETAEERVDALRVKSSNTVA